MKLREKAAMIASQFEGRCTCRTMDGGVDCPWCQVFNDVLQGFPLVAAPARPAPAAEPPIAETVSPSA
ncbi:MAG: hypothetical protein ACREKG_06955 [Candidatus Rokuibacteriota bacterium]